MNKRLRRILGIHDTVDINLARIGSTIVIVMMLLTIADITARFVFINPISGTYEIMRLMLAAVVFLPFAYVQLLRSQIIITIVSERLPPKIQEILSFVWISMALCGLVILAWRGTVATIEAIEIGDVTVGLIPVPTAPARSIIAFGCIMVSIRLLRQVVEAARGFMTGVK